MKPIFRKLLTNFMIMIVPTLFCSLMASPFSYLLPLNCPDGSRVIGIECFDSSYTNTTPWYRRDLGASELAFPFLLAGFSAVAAWNFLATPTSKFDDAPKAPPVQVPASSTSSRTKSKRWLPAECPHCGGAINSQSVAWISSYEATCPYCGGALKE